MSIMSSKNKGHYPFLRVGLFKAISALVVMIGATFDNRQNEEGGKFDAMIYFERYTHLKMLAINQWSLHALFSH